MAVILPEIPLEVIGDTEEQYRALEALRDALETKMQALLVNSDIADITNTAVTVSATYAQSELQQVADDVEVVSDKLDELLATLRLAGVLNV